MKKFIILFSILFLSSTHILAVTDDEILIGFCSAIYPIGNFSRQVVCTKKGNQTTCRTTYRPETIQACREALYKIGLLKPGESPKMIMKRIAQQEENRIKQEQLKKQLENAKYFNKLKNSVNEF